MKVMILSLNIAFIIEERKAYVSIAQPVFSSLECIKEYFYNEFSEAYIKFEYISSYCIKSIDNTYFVMSLIATNNSILYISDKLSPAARHFKRR